ncbi:MAG TPA: SpoIIE family protein phosphatase [Gemmatimonadales bacterium]|nr:SpoIIE family protein phosphatase [Gemmatimonadales bacterium]
MASHGLKLDAGVATLALPGQRESGDLSLVKRVGTGTLVAVVDGLGHGEEAASAAHAAVGALDRYSRESLPELVKRSHTALTGLRGVVLTIAYLDPGAGTMTWLGVGNIEGVLIRAAPAARPVRVGLVPVAGFVGAELTNAQARSVPLGRGDTLILASDGIRSGFADALPPAATSQALADHILARHAKGTDDALVLVARYAG